MGCSSRVHEIEVQGSIPVRGRSQRKEIVKARNVPYEEIWYLNI